MLIQFDNDWVKSPKFSRIFKLEHFRTLRNEIVQYSVILGLKKSYLAIMFGGVLENKYYAYKY